MNVARTIAEDAAMPVDMPDVCPVACRELVVAIIKEGLRQLEVGIITGCRTGSINERRLKDEAHDWFRSRDFQFWCDLIDVDAGAVRAFADRIAAGEETILAKRFRGYERRGKTAKAGAGEVYR